MIRLTPGVQYRVTYRYKILTTPDKGFEVLFYSPTGGAAGNFLPAYTVKGSAGDTGTATLTNTLGSYTDYQARWNVVGHGAIAIDDIRIIDVKNGNVIASEDAEGSNPFISTSSNLGTSGAQVIIAMNAANGFPPYTWSVTGGALPPGVTIRRDAPSSFTAPFSIVLSGLCPKAGDYTFTLAVQDSRQATATKDFKLSVSLLDLGFGLTPPQALLDSPYSFTWKAVNARGAVRFELSNTASIPPGLSLDAASGTISGTPSKSGNYAVGLKISDDAFTVFRTAQLSVVPLRIRTPKMLPTVVDSVPYSVQLEAEGGSPPYRWSVSSFLPGTLRLDAGGVLAGSVHNQSGNYRVTVSATDAAGLNYQKVMILPVPGLSLSLPTITSPNTPALTDIFIDEQVTFPLQVVGGMPPYQFQASGLPAGMQLTSDEAIIGSQSTADAVVRGVSVVPGTFPVTIAATDSSSTPLTTSRTFLLHVQPMSLSTPANSAFSQNYSSKLSVLGGEGPYQWTATNRLPLGWVLDSQTGILSGISQECGNFTVPLQVMDQNGATFSRSYNVLVTCGSVSFPNSQTLADVLTGSKFSVQLSGSGNGALTWSLVGGDLPPGTTLSSGGLLSGTSFTPGLYTFLVKATDGTSAGFRQYSQRIAAHRLAQALIPAGRVGRGYSVALAAWGGTAPYSWQTGTAALPSGLQLASDGTLAGVPASIGQYSFDLVVTDANGSALRLNLQLPVFPASTLPDSAPLTITNSASDDWVFLQQTYDGLTRTAPDPNAASRWLSQLQSGQVTRSVLLAQLWKTTGAGGHAAFVITAYEGLLGRDPAFAEFRTVLNGIADADLIAALMRSPEFQEQAGQLAPPDLIARILGNLLGPSVDPGLVSTWAARGADAPTLASLFHDSALQSIQNRISAAATYYWLYLRAPSAAERDSLSTQLSGGADLSEVLGVLLNRPEFASSFDSAVIHPHPYQPAFRNPLKGMRPDMPTARTHPFATLGRLYVPWNLLEDNENDTIDKIRAVCDQLWGDLPAYNIKVIPRVYLIWPDPLAKYWPSDLTPDDYTSDAFRSRIVRLIGRLGQVWNNDSRIAFIQMGLIGWWGEHHHPSFASSGLPPSLPPDMELLIGDAFRDAFPNKFIEYRNPPNFASYAFGLHWDVFGADRGGKNNDSALMSATLQSPPLTDRWKIAPRDGEIDPTFLGQPDWSINSQQNVVKRFSQRLIDLITTLHWNHLAVLPTLDSSDPDLWDKASQIQNALGYRFEIDEAAYSPQALPGGKLTLHLKMRNTGSAPMYYGWPLEVALLDSATRQPVWKVTWDGIDIRSWLPGQQVDILRTFVVPDNLKPNNYVVAIAILDPSGMVPSARFAVVNYYNGGRTPLGVIGIGTSPATTELNDFDDLQADRSLYYLPPARTPQN